MSNFIYKEREENILIDKLAQSGLITREVLLEIKEYYKKNPYHNFLHALYVARLATFLSFDDLNIFEIKTLMYAALFHDALHSGKATETDEYLSLDIGLGVYAELSKKYDLGLINEVLFRSAIVGTVFKNRGKITNKYGLILSDLDIGVIGTNIFEFCYYNAFSIGNEFNKSPEEWVLDYNYFKFLLSIDKNIILSPEARKILPNSLNVMKQYMTMPKELKLDMYYTLEKEDITFDEFKEKYKNSLQN